jgi:Lrp/AsnC family leucine-responsive transcriptional regulator
MRSAIELDEISLEILSRLQKNSRESFSEIGRIVGLSAPAVAERIKKMEEAGVIKNYSIGIDHNKMGFGILAFMLANLTGNFATQEERTRSVIATIPEVLECHSIAGKDDMVLKVIAYDVPHLKTIIDRIGSFGELNTCIVTSTFRQEAYLDIEKYIEEIKAQKK